MKHRLAILSLLSVFGPDLASAQSALTITATALSSLPASASTETTGTATSTTANAQLTSTPTPTAALNATITALPLPPAQYWCKGGRNATYCAGALLQLAELSGIYGDSKTFPDKPTVGSLNDTLAGFAEIPANATTEDVVDFAERYFQGEGLELISVPIQNFTTTPALLSNISDPIYKGFISEVNLVWSQLIREVNQSALGTSENGTVEFESSFIPLNNSIVVPGGRYREVYYWDSFWILEGLLRSELYNYANDLLNNLLDLQALYGFIPNGGRKYYLNRSQPPVLTQMIHSYVIVTGNTTILDRALPLLEAELEFWRNNRSATVVSPYTNQTHTVYFFNVTNTAPRPEGYVEDVSTVLGSVPALNESQQADLYSEIATGAESGWDFSGRWCKEPTLNLTDNDPTLRTLNIRAIAPVDLNALMAGNHALLATLYQTYIGDSGNNGTAATSGSPNTTIVMDPSNNSTNISSQIAAHMMISTELKSAVNDLFWDPVKNFWYDFNTTANARTDVWHQGGFWPLWQNVTPPALLSNETAAQAVFAGLRYVAGTYEGLPTVSTLLNTGLNWDFPNSWPNHAYTTIKAAEAAGRLFPNATSFIDANVTTSDFNIIPAGQLGLNQSELQPQPADAVSEFSDEYAATLNLVQQGKPWWKGIALEVANKYMQASFCSWYSTGGSIPGVLARLPAAQLNATSGTVDDTGHLFEKFNATDADAAGGGGEYEVVIGFGWTNGVALHTAGEYGPELVIPSCPGIRFVLTAANATDVGGGANGTVSGGTGALNGTTMMLAGYRTRGSSA